MEQSQQAFTEMGEMGKANYKVASVTWLKKKYKANPKLFSHWALLHP